MSIIKLLTPKMTSNTTPSGEVTCSDRYSTNYEPFYAFNWEYGDDSHTWATIQSLPQWICYHFPEPVCVTKITTVNRNENNVRAVSEYTLQGSNNGTNWTDIVTCNLTNRSRHAATTFDNIENNKAYLYYRLYVTGNYNNATGAGCGFAEVELYGYKPIDLIELIPKMTSNTTPKGVASSQWGQDAYKAFDQNSSTSIANGNENSYGYIEYDFADPVTISKVEFTGSVGSIAPNYKDFDFDVYLYYNAQWNLYGSFTLTGVPGDNPSPPNTYEIEEGEISNVLKLKIEAKTQKTYGNGYQVIEIMAYGPDYGNKTGEIVAIRDWFKATRYLKEDVEKFFLRYNSYFPYNLTILASAGSTITLIGRTSLNKYVIKMAGNSVTKLLFFSYEETIEVSDGLTTVVKTLDDQNDIISIIPAYQETVLWDYITDNNGNLKDGPTYDLVLHDNVENYQEIILEVMAYTPDIGGSWDADNFIKIPVGPLMNGITPGKTNVMTGYGIWKDRATVYTLSTNHVQKVYSNYGYNNSMNAVRVIGVKMAYTETLLWDYVRDNSGNIVYDNTALTLAQSINNFDELVIELVSNYTDVTDQNWNGTCFYTIPVNVLINARNANYFNYTSYNERSSRFYASGTTFQKATVGTANTNGIVRVYGINH